MKFSQKNYTLDIWFTENGIFVCVYFLDKWFILDFFIKIVNLIYYSLRQLLYKFLLIFNCAGFCLIFIVDIFIKMHWKNIRFKADQICAVRLIWFQCISEYVVHILIWILIIFLRPIWIISNRQKKKHVYFSKKWLHWT